MRKFAGLSVALLLLCSTGATFSGDALPLVPVADELAAPDFELRGADGRSYRLSDYRGKPVVLNFWATWCPPCVAELPSMERAYPSFKREGIELLAINVGDDPNMVREFLAENPVSFPTPLDVESEVAVLFALTGVPTTWVIDSNGRLAYSLMGEIDWTTPALLERLKALR